jgi:hypothetical protein
MAEDPQTNRPSLSEISHLFLSELRQKQGGTGAARPQRIPPGANRSISSPSIDITPREFAAGLHVGPADHPVDASEDSPRPEISVVVAHHLGVSALQRVGEYARHLAKASGRVGLIELGDEGLRLTCFDASQPAAEQVEPAQLEPADGDRIGEVLEELSWDVRRWLLFLPAGAKSIHARDLLNGLPMWTLLVTADDEGTVAAYRALKGMTAIGKPALSLAVLDGDGAQAEIIHRKLAGASKQFLDRPIELEGLVTAGQETARDVAENIVLWCRASAAATDHWTAVAELAAKAFAPVAEETEIPTSEPVDQADAIDEQPVAEPIPMPIPMNANTTAQLTPTSNQSAVSEVVDLPADAGSDQILAAMLRQGSVWVASPVKAPMCPDAIVAVDREGRLTLLAALGEGLSALPSISRALSWLTENRLLVRMAVPQMNIDAGALPRLMLFADAAASTGRELGAILGGGNVTVQTYRKLRWGEKTGLLLAA